VKMTGAFAKKADEYNDKLATLGGKVGALAAGITVALLPALELVVDGVTAVVDAISKLPEPFRVVIGVVAGLGVALSALAVPLGVLAGTGLWTTITTAFTGFLTFMGTTFVPAMVAFFSGPVGWVTLAVIAVAAMVYAFREPIGKFLAWMGEQLAGLGESIGDALTGIGSTVYNAVDGINKSIRAGIAAAWGWLGERFNDLGKMLGAAYDGAVSVFGKLGDAVARPFSAVVNVIKDSMRNVLQFIADRVNIVAGMVNRIIAGYNSLPTPDLPLIPTVQVPSFAGGGYTGNAPRSGGLDGQGGFMAMLHPRETVIDHAKTSGGGVPNITIRTGEVLQMPDGSQWVSMGDLEQAMAATASAVMGQLRTPAGRIAMGGA
jgi:hypothetical protein